MPADIYQFTNYKQYLQTTLARGERAKLAEFVGCQPSFLSQVLTGKPDLALEHGLLTAEFLALGKEETLYFMDLLGLARAGSKKLKDFYLKKIAENQRHREQVSAQIQNSLPLSIDQKYIYYSDWKFSAAHVLASVPKTNQLEWMSQKLGLSIEETKQVIQTLLQCGVLESVHGKARPTKKRIHLDGNDDLVLALHRNHRLRTMEEFRRIRPENLHFSLLTAISREDAKRIKKIFLRSISEIEKVTAPSPEEAAYSLALDFFEI